MSQRSGLSNLGQSEGNQALSGSVAGQIETLLDEFPAVHGLVLVAGNDPEAVLQQLLENSSFYIAVVVPDQGTARRVRDWLLANKLYGERAAVWPLAAQDDVPFIDGLFNLVIDDLDQVDLERLVAPGGIYCDISSGVHRPIVNEQQLGAWRHQYGSPANTADSGDPLVGRAAGFRLRWFGGVGPSRIPDRHLRGPAPLAAGSSMVIHGDGVLIGVDPANGVERWELVLPTEAMRYVMPFDGGYTALDQDGSELWVAAGKEIWSVDSLRGDINSRIPMPEFAQQLQWGYLAEQAGHLFATCMRPTAPRLQLARGDARKNYSDMDYRSARPLVCSRYVCRLDGAGNLVWHRPAQGVVPHSSIAVDKQMMVWIEGRSSACQQHPTDRVAVSDILEDGYLICCDTKSGELVWESRIEWPSAKNMLYALVVDDFIIVASSGSQQDSAVYELRAYSARDGSLLWQQRHTHVRKGLYHGEQVQHPVALRQGDNTLIVAEPFFYELATGKRLQPAALGEQGFIQRPGHSCGALSGAGQCLFFRASNPTVLNLSVKDREDAFTKLSPSRPSCWINMIPATGRLLIPEGSASCVCNYSIQTSMAFEPILGDDGESGPILLPEVIPANLNN